jgi:hypothetical protein
MLAQMMLSKAAIRMVVCEVVAVGTADGAMTRRMAGDGVG